LQTGSIEGEIMRFTFSILIAGLFFVSISNAQELSREQKLQKITELNNQIKTLENDVISPTTGDLKAVQKEGFNVIRLLPRERYDHKLTIQGGGSYYSFTTGSHDYQKIAQIGLEQNNLKVGFAGANYGFINDLGEMSLADVTKETVGVSFLVNYRPPTDEPSVRIEQRKAWNYEVDGISYKSRIPAIVGHSYVLRAISFDDADILVALKVHRKDTDGSLIIFWKNIENFETPKLERNKTVAKDSETTVETIDSKTANAVQNALNKRGFFNVSVEATIEEIVMRGTVPKGKLGEAVRVVQETGNRKVRNELTEQ